MNKIKELIVVEGRHDTANIRKYFDCDTRETNGTRISKELLADLRQIAKTRHLIIFTDPDSSGQQIRNRIAEAIPDCRHAYLPAIACRKKERVGIEYASETELKKALANLISYENKQGELTMSDLLDWGLCGEEAAKKREKLAKAYHLGDCNAKALLKRLNALNVSRDEIESNGKNAEEND